MHLETLRTFCDLVESGSLSRAAKKNHVTQSAVSQQLRSLETRYGRRLVDRAPRLGARPTEAGQRFYEGVRLLLERFAALEQELRDDAATVSGKVRVATVYSVGLHTLPPAMKKFVAAHPKVSVHLEYRRTDQVYEACLDGSIDMGIVAIPRKRKQLAVAALGQDELVLVTPPGHPLCARRRTRLADLEGTPFVAFARDIPTRKLVDQWLSNHGVRVTRVMELDNVETIKRSVEAGLGVSILPAPTLQAELRSGTLVRSNLKEGPLMRPIGVIHASRQTLSKAARAFLELLAEELVRPP
jgi:LysR family transcriptional regulator, transcriptional activator of the cysJI operon